jgi:hypothetical protein
MSVKRTILREVNERIRERNHAGPRQLTDRYDLICECGGPACARRVAVPANVFDDLRQDERRFLVAPGHVLDDQRVVASRHGYTIVTV